MLNDCYLFINRLTTEQLVYVLDLHWLTLVTLIKLSILQFYSVVFHKPVFAMVAYGVMAIVIAYWIGTFWVDAFLCDPPRKAVSGIHLILCVLNFER